MVLDVGAGEGGDAMWLAEQGWQVTANDISRRALDRIAGEAERRKIRRYGNIRPVLPGVKEAAAAWTLTTPPPARPVHPPARALLGPPGRSPVAGPERTPRQGRESKPAGRPVHETLAVREYLGLE